MSVAQKRQLLVEAEAAYHNLMLGQAAVEVTDQNGEKIVFNRTSKAALAQYIQELKSQIGVVNRKPMRAFF